MLEVEVLPHTYRRGRVWSGGTRATWTCSICGDVRSGSAHADHPPNQDEECPRRLRAAIADLIIRLDPGPLPDPNPPVPPTGPIEVPCPYTSLQKPCVGARCPFWLAAHRDVRDAGEPGAKTEPTGLGCCAINPHHANWPDPSFHP